MKKFNTTMLSLFSVFMLAACSEQGIKNETKSIFEDSSKLEKVQMSEFTKENSKLNNALIDSLGIAESEFEMDELEEYKDFKKNINKAKEKIELTVTEVISHDNKNAELLMDVSYLNIGSVIAETINEELERNVVKIYNEEEVSEESFYKNTLTVLNDSLIEVFESGDDKYITVEKDVRVKLSKENNKWTIKTFDEDVMNALTLNFHKEQKDLVDKKIKEIKENRVFIEKETNLKLTFETVKDFILSKEIDVSKLSEHSEAIKKEINSKVGVPSDIVKELSNEEGIYYIIPEENKLTVIVISENRTFTLTDNLQK